jgi:hypothetical protein
VATPDIGNTISEGYSRGLDRMSGWLPALAVLGIAMGVIAGVGAQINDSLIPDAGDIFSAALRGDLEDFDANDLRVATIVSAVVGAINLLLSYGAYALYGGILHRERHGTGSEDAIESPTPGSVIPAVLAQVGNLMPKIAMLTGLFVVGQAGGALLGGVGSFVGLVAWIFWIYLAIKWVYAPIVAGAGEATGDGAFARSEEGTGGSWWGTFGCFIVIGLAVALPIGIVAIIVSAVVPGALALETAWAQVEARSGGDTPPVVQPPMAEPRREEPPTPPTPSAPDAGPDAGPGTPPATDDRGPFV